MSAQATFDDLTQLSSVAIAMRQRGVLVDDVARANHTAYYRGVLAEAQERFKSHAPADFTLGAAGTHSSLKRLFFEHFKRPALRFSKETGAPSLDAWTLQQYALPHNPPECRALANIALAARKAAKLTTTYLDKLPVSEDGRVHCAWNVWGAITGRWSSALPNMQNIPKKLRDMFVAACGHLLVAADYDKLELRIVAILANDKPLLRAFAEGVDVHTANALDLFGMLPEDPKERSKKRDFGKRFVYGANYGGSAETLHASLVVDYPQMQLGHITALLKRWFEKHPAIKRWHVSELRKARDSWKVFCPVGHRYTEFPDGRVEPNKVINYPAQSAAGWLANRAIINWHKTVQNEGFVTLQVHDELAGEFPLTKVTKAAAALKSAMEEPVELCGKEWVFPCELKVGTNWGTMVKFDNFLDWINA